MNKIRFLLIFLVTQVFSQNITVSGYVQDGETGEKLIGATVYEHVSKNLVVTNNYGYFSISVPHIGETVLSISYLGYETIQKKVYSDRDVVYTIQLFSNNNLDEVVIVAKKERPIQKQAEIGVISIPISQIESLPSIGGETDIIKALQLMPGVQSGSEGSSQLYVRGGSPDQNLILLDDVPLYYVNHLGGFVSTFNTDAINNIKLIKGGFPAFFGNRLSSVLDIRMKDGNHNELLGNAMIGLLASKITIEGPIKKRKASFIISARRMLYDLLSSSISKIGSDGEISQGYYFYDVNTKLNYEFSEKDHLFLSTYLGDDRVFINLKNKEQREKNKSKSGWGNRLLALRWNHLYNQKLFSNLTFSFTRYRFIREFNSKQIIDNLTNKSFGQFKSGIYDLSAKIDFEYNLISKYKLKFGGGITNHTFKPGITKYNSYGQNQTIDTVFNSQKLKALEGNIYCENLININDIVKFNIGLRIDEYLVNRKLFHSFEPRILANVLLSQRMSIVASYSKMQQNIHLLSTSGVGMPIDLWMPATELIAPEKSEQWSAGLHRSINNGLYEFSLEGYYKEMKNLISYKEGASYFGLSNGWEDKVESKGNGWSYGIELLLQKKSGKSTGWLSYTWAVADRQFEKINFSKRYPFKYDRRHDISLVFNHKFNKKINFSATWVYGTGYAMTLATSHYEIIEEPIGLEFIEAHYYDGKNNFRMRDFHKLDIGVQFHKQKKRGERIWNLSVYNAYNRQNPYYYFFDSESEYDSNGEIIDGTNKLVLKQQSLFPIIPSVSYSFKF